jgi:hypothetical protein
MLPLIFREGMEAVRGQSSCHHESFTFPSEANRPGQRHDHRHGNQPWLVYVSGCTHLFARLILVPDHKRHDHIENC